MGDEARTKGRLPEWLNGQTLALATVMAAFAAMVQAGFGNLRDDLEGRMDRLSTEVRTDIRELQTEVRADIRGLDERLRNVEVRLERVELRLGNVERRLDDVEHRLGNVEHRLDGVEQRLDSMEQRLEGMDVRLTRVEEALPAPGRGAVALVPPPAGGDAAGTRDGQGAAASNDALRQIAP